MNTLRDPECVDDVSLNLESLVGRRARSQIVHPKDGRVLVQRGCIITRSAIRDFAAGVEPTSPE